MEINVIIRWWRFCEIKPYARRLLWAGRPLWENLFSDSSVKVSSDMQIHMLRNLSLILTERNVTATTWREEWLLYSFQSAFNGSNLIDLIYRINSVSVSLYIKRFDRLETATSYPRLLLRQRRVRCFWENRRTIKLEFKPFTLRQT